MTKFSKNIAATVLPILFAGLISSCKKESLQIDNDPQKSSFSQNKKPISRPYKDNFDTDYQFVPDFANGWTPPNPAPAWYPGNGEGNATHLGKASTFFNQYATLGPTGLVSLAAPVNMFFASQLGAVGISVPNEVSSIVFDKKGNSVWFKAISNTTMPVSNTRINFSGMADIIGGTGKFTGATGQVEISGFFNPTDQSDAGVSSVGQIAY